MVGGEPRQLLLAHAEPDFAVIDRPAAAGAVAGTAAEAD
jgi:hypothetical protein